jgi:CYTH domain-containing protein
LLTGVPRIAREVVPLEIDQGWIAGKMVSERVRRTRASGAENYSRTIKLGEGVVRSEFEEPMTPDVFETMWPLTVHRRISKRRYPVPDGDRVWEIDEFTDRELVLAEVELDGEEEQVTPPDWLKPYVVREVTGEPEYVNVNLAR